ncbi:hypothetical protein BT63DRAFT_453074 [Microthyrium microscopicum]|uniref:Uncharacterized protein n=1 Tax=Microthyrium microscopicum TaxID=703497 RepID=A0A6A6UIJ3_9PEZI|nr:hypothetical protein BT63DRAFT_453074 [Microthyrium microscopicum]
MDCDKSVSGLHGLALHPGSGTNASSTVWATVQFDNAMLLIDPKGDDINNQFTPKGYQDHSDIFSRFRTSRRIVRISISNPNDHQVWAVSGRPIFIAIHPTSGDVYSGLDTSSKIWHYKNDGGKGEEIAVTPKQGSTPVGLIAGADGNAWVVLLGDTTSGTGTFWPHQQRRVHREVYALFS